MATSHDQTVNKNAVEFVRLGLVESVSLGFTAPVCNWATFSAMMATVRRGNGFDPREIIKTFRPLFDDSMGVELGREGSEVLYVRVPYYPGQRLGVPWTGIGERYGDEWRQDFTRRVIEWARSMGADEISVQQHPVIDRPVWNKPGEHPHKVRIWWD